MDNRLDGILQQLRRAVRPAGADETDARLLERYLRQRDEAAFEALVRRHGAMVLGVCRRVLGNEQDAEDVFQATFLILVRKAGSVRKRGSLGAWLYGVAYRTAREARRAMARRRAKEASVIPQVHASAPAEEDLREVLDRELAALPEHYRAAVVLCDLEGKGRKEAARLLGCAEGTVASRLARGRSLLARRLARCGLSLAALAAARTASARVSTALVSLTVKAACAAAGPASLVSANVVSLVERVVRTMLLVKLRVMTVVLLLVGTAGSGAGWLYYHRAEAAPPAQAAPSEQEKLRQELNLLQADLRRATERAAALEARLKEMDEEPAEVLFRGKPAAYWKKALRDRDPAYRKEAVMALGSIARVDRSVVPALRRTLKDDEVEVRQRAAEQLAGIGKAAVPLLVEALQDREHHRAGLCRAIGMLNRDAEEAVPALMEVLKSGDWMERQAAAEALGGIGRGARAAAPALVELLKSRYGQESTAAVFALGKIGPSAKKVVPELIEMLRDSEAHLRQASAQVLGSIGPEAKEAVPGLITLLKRKDLMDMYFAAIALGNIGPDARPAIPALVHLLQHSPTGDVYQQVRAAMKKIDPKALAQLEQQEKGNKPRP
jgi:RNA polymerase sigma factor (sigma-70 family)